jgi:hypothetical protein
MKKGYGLIEMGSRMSTGHARTHMSIKGSFGPSLAVEEMVEHGAAALAIPFEVLGPKLE